MSQPVVHFEIIGTDPDRLRDYYAALFGWDFETGGPVAGQVSAPGRYGFTDSPGGGIPGGVGGGPGFAARVLFYVGVPDVAAAVVRAQSLGGTCRMGPDAVAGRDLVVAHVADPEGNLIGLAGPA